eukprot:753358-Hanusia_phi.AAC.3
MCILFEVAIVQDLQASSSQQGLVVGPGGVGKHHRRNALGHQELRAHSQGSASPNSLHAHHTRREGGSAEDELRHERDELVVAAGMRVEAARSDGLCRCLDGFKLMGGVVSPAGDGSDSYERLHSPDLRSTPMPRSYLFGRESALNLPVIDRRGSGGACDSLMSGKQTGMT